MKNIAKIGLLVMVLISFGLMFSSSWDDALTFDENSHIAAGYSYLTERDMRANPEHPPIIKDLAALPLLFFDLAYEKGPSWDVELNPQWSQGDLFMFGLGNNPDTIMRASRTPIMLLSILTALFLFGWEIREKSGMSESLSISQVRTRFLNLRRTKEEFFVFSSLGSE